MKNYLILISVLSLVACGGGSTTAGTSNNDDTFVSGGDEVTNDNNNTNLNSVVHVSDEAIASNNILTSLPSEISVTQNGAETLYRINNAKFFANDMQSDDTFVSFGIDDDGKITSMIYNYSLDGQNIQEPSQRENATSDIFVEEVYKYRVLVGDRWYYTDSLMPAEYSRAQIKQAFREAYQNDIDESILAAIEQEVDESDALQPEQITHRVRFDLYGKNMPDFKKLRYSDFGYSTILANSDTDTDDNTVIFGGYEVKEIQHPENMHDLRFSGKAVASLGNIHENGVRKIETGVDSTTLVVDANGNETLTMPFDNYYTIYLQRPRNGAYDVDWQGNTSVGYELNDNNATTNIRFDVRYYGDTESPSEAVGGVGFYNNGVDFGASFGVALQQ